MGCGASSLPPLPSQLTAADSVPLEVGNDPRARRPALNLPTTAAAYTILGLLGEGNLAS